MAAATLNILYLIRTWAFGGGQTIALTLMKHVPRDRFRIVCVPYDSHSGGDEVFIAEARKRGLDVAPERIPWKSRRNVGRARDTVSALIEKYNIDLIHTHDPQSNTLIGLGRKRWRCACVASPYGWWRRLLPLRSHVYTWAENNLALPNFDRVITVSNDMKSKILKGRTSEDRIRVIYTGIEPERMSGGASRMDTRHALGLEQDHFVIGTVGRLYSEKGLAYLIHAVRILEPAFPRIRLLIVGAGPEREALEALAARLSIREKVIFTGFYDDLAGALRAMDVYAQSSVLDEGLPTALLEAQLAGLPVVATDTGGTKEALDPGLTGLLAKPRSPKSLADAIRLLLEDSGRRFAMAQAAPAWVRGRFTLERMIAQVEQTYNEALETYRARR